VFHPEDIEKIADFMENYPHEKEPQLWLDIDDVSIPMNPFVQKIFTQVLTGNDPFPGGDTGRSGMYHPILVKKGEKR